MKIVRRDFLNELVRLGIAYNETDNLRNKDIVSNAIKTKGYSVVGVTEDQDALLLLSQKGYSVILDCPQHPFIKSFFSGVFLEYGWDDIEIEENQMAMDYFFSVMGSCKYIMATMWTTDIGKFTDMRNVLYEFYIEPDHNDLEFYHCFDVNLREVIYGLKNETLKNYIRNMFFSVFPDNEGGFYRQEIYKSPETIKELARTINFTDKKIDLILSNLDVCDAFDKIDKVFVDKNGLPLEFLLPQ